MEWGTLTHALWEGVWRRFRERKEEAGALFVQLVREEWDRLVSQDGAYKDFEPFTGDSRLRRRLENTRFRVLRLGSVQGLILDRMRQAGLQHRDIWLEEDASLSLVVDGVTFTGQCDRVEVLEGPGLETGCCALITDYKAGKSEKSEEGLSLKGLPWNADGREKFRVGLQLSAYAVMFERRHADIPLAGVGFLGLEDGMMAGTVVPEVRGLFSGVLPSPGARSRPPSLSERGEEAECAMRNAAAILRSGAFPPAWQSKVCNRCGMRGVCRRGEFLGEPLGDADDDEETDCE